MSFVMFTISLVQQLPNIILFIIVIIFFFAYQWYHIPKATIIPPSSLSLLSIRIFISSSLCFFFFITIFFPRHAVMLFPFRSTATIILSLQLLHITIDYAYYNIIDIHWVVQLMCALPLEKCVFQKLISPFS